jgi:hypothetical protein
MGAAEQHVMARWIDSTSAAFSPERSTGALDFPYPKISRALGPNFLTINSKDFRCCIAS